ncbi:hypothetical protein AB0F15_00765 [Amycolatopsis sp. NPDC026612]|uniref:hypothetical protein n=1 Tax=Amycolatopsis sp. NPDC026612 TaxID=3155466 RepID=UPI0033DB8D36
MTSAEDLGDERNGASNASIPVTGAAEELIEKFADDQRLILLGEIERSKSRDRPADSRISADEVQSAIGRLRWAESGQDRGPYSLGRSTFDVVDSWIRDTRIRRMVLVILSVALLVIFAIIFVVAFAAQFADWIPLFASLILGVLAGSVFSVVGLGVGRRKGAVASAHRGMALAFARRVEAVEALARAVIFTKSETVQLNAPLGSVLDWLVESNIWSTEDVANFRHLLRVRNAIVHEDTYLIPLSESRDLGKVANVLSEKLRKVADPDGKIAE